MRKIILPALFLLHFYPAHSSIFTPATSYIHSWLTFQWGTMKEYKYFSIAGGVYGGLCGLASLFNEAYVRAAEGPREYDTSSPRQRFEKAIQPLESIIFSPIGSAIIGAWVFSKIGYYGYRLPELLK